MELHVIGEVASGEDFGPGSHMCKWQFVQGDGWAALEGATEGQTQADSAADGDDLCVWAHPLDVHFRTTSLSGWPRIRLQVWHHDQYGRNELAGYGMVHIPARPGIHELACPTWRPKGSFFEELTAYFLGGAPRLLDESAVSSAASRKGLRTISSGTVHLRLAILLKDHQLHGIGV